MTDALRAAPTDAIRRAEVAPAPPPAGASWGLRRRLGLRSRVTLVFAVGALILAALMSTLAFWLAREYLLNERETSAKHQTLTNARLVRSGLRSAEVDITKFLGTLPTGSESDALVYRNGRWFTTSVGLGPDQLPGDIMRKALDGSAAMQRFDDAGTTSIAVAVPISSVDAVYFQVFSLRELDSTLRILSASLAVAALVTAFAGAVIGRWASRRALQPVRDVAIAAGDIAGGNLETRLRVAEDPDLARLAGAFNAMVDALRARIARDARFASDISHELRSPLTTLATSLVVLGRNTGGWTDAQRQALELMRAETTAFQRLVEDLLEDLPGGRRRDQPHPGPGDRGGVPSPGRCDRLPRGADRHRGGRRAGPAAHRQAAAGASLREPGTKCRALRRRGGPAGPSPRPARRPLRGGRRGAGCPAR